MAASQPLGFAAIFGGALLLLAGLTDSSLASVAKGAPDHAHKGSGSAGAGEPGAAAPGGAAPPPGSIKLPGSSGASSKSKQELQAYVRAYARNLGWSASDWEAVIERESGWNPTARNPSTGAYGIGQFNPENAANPMQPRPGSTAALYARFGALSSDPRKQIQAMAQYIRAAYGNPTKALASEHTRGWY